MRDLSLRHALALLVATLLLATLLGMQRLDSEALWYDEMWSVDIARGTGAAPLNASEVLANVIYNDPTQGPGYPLLLAGWGALAGWSEFAVRVLSLFGGLLAVALAYRVGREVAGRPAGVLAAASLAVSAFFVWYMHEARTYTLVVALGLLLLWAYRRILYAPAAPGWRSGAAFILGGAGLLYANYYAVALPAALALYHLWQPKNRRWWYATWAGGLAVVAFLPAVIGMVNGIERYSTWEEQRARALSLPQLLGISTYFAANGAVLLLLLLCIAGGVFAWRHGPSARGLVLVTLLTVALSLLMQAVLNVIEITKIRYVLALWGPLAVWAALGLLAVGRGLARARLPRPAVRGLAALLPALWLAGGLHASLDPFFMTENGPTGDLMRWRTLTNILREQALPQHDVLAYYSGRRAHDDVQSFQFSMREVAPLRTFITFSVFDAATADTLQAQTQAAARVWYGMDRRFPPDEEHTRFLALLAAAGLRPCPGYFVAEPALSLQLYAQSPAYCPGGPVVVQAGAGIALTGWPPLPATVRGDWTIPTGWTLAADVPPETYSVAFHLMQGDTFITGSDAGLPGRRFGLLAHTLALADVPPGTYGLHLVVYAWRSGARLTLTRADGTTGTSLLLGTVQVTR